MSEGATGAGGPATKPPAIGWHARSAAVALVDTLPALVVAPFDVPLGLGLAFGVLPAALLGVLPRRRDRVRVFAVGVVTGIPMLLGSLVSDLPVVAVVTVFVAGLGGALLATRRLFGSLALALAVPMIGIGLSFEPRKGAAVALLMVVGSAYAWLVSLLWPERTGGAPPAAAASPPLPSVPAMRDYGIRYGLAGASAAAIGFAFDVDHVGWQVAAALLVMRPRAEMQRLRSVGRIVSVTIGAFLAAWVATATIPDVVYGVLGAAAVVGAAGTRPSRWYVTPFFTTFVAISLLLYGHPGDVEYRFGQRVVETVVGVALAYAFGLVWPALRARIRSRPA